MPPGAALPPGAVVIGGVVAGPPEVRVDGQPARLRSFEHFAEPDG
jgi:hypothetical protein